jgi:hypothetical protein
MVVCVTLLHAALDESGSSGVNGIVRFVFRAGNGSGNDVRSSKCSDGDKGSSDLHYS